MRPTGEFGYNASKGFMDRLTSNDVGTNFVAHEHGCRSVIAGRFNA
jgi:hypothetical protein